MTDDAMSRAREALCRGVKLGQPIPPCRCWNECAPPLAKKHCHGVCEEATEHIAAALREAEARGAAAGYKRGIEDAAKVCDTHFDRWEAVRKHTHADAIRAVEYDIRALAETGGERG